MISQANALERGETVQNSANRATSLAADAKALLPYVAELELEVDRLRKQDQFVRHEVRESLKRIHRLCRQQSPLAEAEGPFVEIGQVATRLAEVLRDLQELPGYHPAHDQVTAIAVRPLAEKVFRWQQRLLGVPAAVLRLELESEHMEWFPTRLRHVLDNLFSNALKFHDCGNGEPWVRLELRTLPAGYELRVSDNGVGLPADDYGSGFELLFRTARGRIAGLGVGLAVVKLLVQQSGGTLTVQTEEDSGTTFVAVLPRYDVDDYLL